jgi:hypothetical protein
MLYSYERGPKPCFHMRDTGACPVRALLSAVSPSFCASHADSVLVQFGDSCQFSHDSEVLRRAAAVASAADRGEPAFSQPAWSKGPWNRKTKLCKSFKQWGACQYGQACKFAHGPEELRVFDGWDPDVGKEVGLCRRVCVCETHLYKYRHEEITYCVCVCVSGRRGRGDTMHPGKRISRQPAGSSLRR